MFKGFVTAVFVFMHQNSYIVCSDKNYPPEVKEFANPLFSDQ